MNNALATPDTILEFWFSPTARKCWFNSTRAFDQQVTDRFLATWQAAAEGRLAEWEATANGALALVIVLDQFPLNMFRDQPEGFSTEAASRAVAERAIAKGFDQALDAAGQGFLYLPSCIVNCSMTRTGPSRSSRPRVSKTISNGHGTTATSCAASGGFRIAMPPSAARAPPRNSLTSMIPIRITVD